MTRFSRWVKTCALVVLMAGAQVCVSANDSAAATSDVDLPHVPADIPVGSTAESDETSRGVTAVLMRAAHAHKTLGALSANGNYVGVTKSVDGTTSHVAASVTIDYESPDRLAVRTRGENAIRNTAFVADGKQVAIEWGVQFSTGTLRRYFSMDQPPSLASYTADHLPGELYRDYADVLGTTVLPQLFLHPQPLRVVGFAVQEYIYEGTEEVSGKPCHRIRYQQERPASIVILWLDAESFLLHKSSIIKSYDDEYNLVESFDEGELGDMMIMQWDRMTTDPASVDQSAFEWSPPDDAMPFVPEVTSGWISEPEKESFWQSLVSSAAETTDKPTTFALVHEQGTLRPVLEKVTELDAPPVAVESARLPGESQESVFLIMDDGTVSVRGYNGEVKKEFSIGMSPQAADIMTTVTGEVEMILATSQDSRLVSAFRLDGSRAWDYSYPYANVLGMEAGRNDPVVFVGLDSLVGLRKLNHEGKVLYGAHSRPPIIHFWDLGSEADLLLVYSTHGTVLVDRDLMEVRDITPDSNIRFLVWDDKNPDAPLISLSTNSEQDILVQRRRKNGDAVWTTTVAPSQVDVVGGAVVMLKASENGEKPLLTFTSAGHIMLLDKDGKVLYRGRMTADYASIERNGGVVINHIALGDVDGDGREELYLILDKTLLRLKI